jgi:hypothetical protein
MAQDITEKENTNRSYRKPQSIDTEQLEYTTGRIFVYGGLTFVLVTLGVTYIYLLVQKIKT